MSKMAIFSARWGHTREMIQAWMAAIRVKTLLIPTIQVMTCVSLASRFTEKLSWGIALGAWFVSVLITIGTNLINDVIDFEKGGDSVNPLGQLKVIRLRLLSKRSVKAAGFGAFIAACLIAWMLPVSNAVFFLVLLSCVCGYCYTGGPYPISYNGLSEVFILLFYGGVCILTGFYVLTGMINASSFLLAFQMGCLAILPNALNNYRDFKADRAVNKKTLAVRFGLNFAQREIGFLIIFPFLINLLWLQTGFPLAALLPLCLLPLVVLFLRQATKPLPLYSQTEYSGQDIMILRTYYNKLFALGIAVHFLFGIALVLAFLLSW